MNRHRAGAMIALVALATESALIMRGYQAHHLAKINEPGRGEKAAKNGEIAFALENAVTKLAQSIEFDEGAFENLAAATEKAARTFRTYESHHRAKDGEDRTERADRNADIAERIERTLGALSAWRTLADRHPIAK